MKNKKIIIITVIIAIVLILIIGLVFIGIPAYLNYSARKSFDSTLSSNSNIIANETANNFNSISEQLKEVEKATFNQNFISYETKESGYSTPDEVLALFYTIAIHNENAKETRKVDVNGTIITNINLESVKSVVDKEKTYNIKCILDNEGYVKTIELRFNK